ncbi:MAG TPA: SirB2 family protein, partial [Gammaproteobacteria bacterium]|nr:SirB2 family protein [Gammaproteobacteria bacterium]
MNWYLHLKYLHLTCVVLTFISFSLRGYWMLTDNALLQRPLTRTVPHIIDAILLTTGISLVVMFYNGVFTQPWLLLKLGGLFLYIILGALALRYGRTKPRQVISLIGAWLTFFCIIAIAR